MDEFKAMENGSTLAPCNDTGAVGRRGFFKYAAGGVLAGSLGLILGGKAEAAKAPKLNHAMWTHGTSIQEQFPSSTAGIWRYGDGSLVFFNSGESNVWLQFAIPTPLIVKNKRLKIQSVMLDFRTWSSDVRVTAVNAYDGSTLIAQYNDVFTGDHPFEKFDVPGHPLVYRGINIQVGVSTGVAAMDHMVTFRSAGGDFI